MLRYQMVAGKGLRSARLGGTCFRVKKTSVTTAKGAMHVPRYWWLADCETRTCTALLFPISVNDATSPARLRSVEKWLCTLSYKGLEEKHWRPISVSFLYRIAGNSLYMWMLVLRAPGFRFSAGFLSLVSAKGILCILLMFTHEFE
jgi:hypothetical protein